MIPYLIYAPLNILLMLFCYITNPIVVLFADETGELHSFLRYWQTWDDSLDPAFFVKRKVPKYTTQTCHNCGYIMKGEEKLTLEIREWTCPVCGKHHIRDVNAAQNLLAKGKKKLAGRA